MRGCNDQYLCCGCCWLSLWCCLPVKKRNRPERPNEQALMQQNVVMTDTCIMVVVNSLFGAACLLKNRKTMKGQMSKH